MTETAGRQITSPVDNHDRLKDARDVLSPTNHGIEALKDITFGSVSNNLWLLQMSQCLRSKDQSADHRCKLDSRHHWQIHRISL